jgi:prolipoprotein diacylglyceryltransferase
MPLASILSPSRSSWHLGPLPLRAQALCVVAGIVLAIWIADRRYRKAGGSRGAITDVAAWAVPAGLIPAAIGALAATAHGGGWQAVRTWDAVAGFPGAVALGILAAWLACRGRLRFDPVAAAAAPAIAFGLAVASLGGWFSQQGYGRPSSLPWAVAISPAHRPAGYENFATFQPVFLYLALWSAAAGVAVAVATRRLGLRGDRALALAAAAYAVGGFTLFWLGIGHLPVVFGLRAGELGDAAVLVGSAVYLARTRPSRIKPLQPAQKPALESDSPVL